MRKAVAVVLFALAALPSTALAAGTTTGPNPTLSGAPGSNALGSPLTPGIPQSPASTPTTTTTPPTTTIGTTTSGSSSGLSGSSALVIVLGAVALLCAISFFIWRDARRRAPVRSYAAAIGDTRSGSKRPPKPRKLSPAERRRRKRGRARR